MGGYLSPSAHESDSMQRLRWSNAPSYDTSRSLVEILNDDTFLRICRFLLARSLVDTGATCRELHHRTRENLDLWQGLCESLLGRATLVLHEIGWGVQAADRNTAGFYKRIFKAAWACSDFCYDHECRGSLLRSLRDEQVSNGLRRSAQISLSGHTAEAIGPLVLQVGGGHDRTNTTDIINVTVVNLSSRKMFQPMLSDISLHPRQRIRHASCVVRVPNLPAAAYHEAILVLGGHDGNFRSPGETQPSGNMKTVLLLQVMQTDGSEVRWQEFPATGTCPEHMYNLACGSFAGGRRVCVFGGDIPTADPEFQRIVDRRNVAFVYVLNLETLNWEVVTTCGNQPTWRSFHAGVTHTSFLDGKAYFVTFGGTEEHCKPFTVGKLADMCGYKLDLSSFHWKHGVSNGFMPQERMRFGAARWGRHLLISGGHGGDAIIRDRVARLNLCTLRWSRVHFSNNPPPFPGHGFETGSPQAGCIIGGVQQSMLGPSFPERLVVFRLLDPSGDAQATIEAAMGPRTQADDNHDANPETTGTLMILARWTEDRRNRPT